MTKAKPFKRSLSIHAFTLLEFIITLAVLAVITTLALPSFNRLQAGLESKNIYPQLKTVIQQYKQHAVIHRQVVILCATDDGKTCTQTNQWNHGILAVHDQNRNRKIDSTDPILSFHAHRISYGHLTWKGSATAPQYIILQSDTGLPRGSMGSFIYCSNSSTDSNLSHKNALSHMGHLRQEKLNSC